MSISPVSKVVYEARIGKWRVHVNTLGGLFLAGPRGRRIYIPPEEPLEHYRLPKYLVRELEKMKKKEIVIEVAEWTDGLITQVCVLKNLRPRCEAVQGHINY